GLHARVHFRLAKKQLMRTARGQHPYQRHASFADVVPVPDSRGDSSEQHPDTNLGDVDRGAS
ncbi:MAG: hypothetical protein ACREMY_24925, partial [bacterium]